MRVTEGTKTWNDEQSLNGQVFLCSFCSTLSHLWSLVFASMFDWPLWSLMFASSVDWPVCSLVLASFVDWPLCSLILVSVVNLNLFFLVFVSCVGLARALLHWLLGIRLLLATRILLGSFMRLCFRLLLVIMVMLALVLHPL